MTAIYAVVTVLSEHPADYGVPEGYIYAALQAAGLTDAEGLIFGLVQANVVRRVQGPRLERGALFDRYVEIIRSARAASAN